MISDLVSICKKGGDIIKDNFNKKLDVKKKSSIDLVTDVDYFVEKVVKEELDRKFPSIEIIAEESALDNIEEEKPVFYLDPVDGTTNFVHGFPFVAVSLAYYVKNRGEIGIVYNPIMEELFTAERSNGAFLNGKAIKVSSTGEMVNSLIGTGFPYSIVESGDNEVIIQRLRNILESSRGIRRAGSAALDLCYTAKGVFDGYYESGLKPWDVAAGKIILEEAGGHVSSLGGGEYDFNEPWIVGSNGLIHDHLIDKINIS
ncbi:MAG: inositol monophosphatase [Flexistipes sinusarabici]|uniref:Inositol-1-monophosphatase n=1 Tax=Flexistipes sinusarabici TaxID=2352 RepID=A0A5D0MJI2_FLESI|nr:inositol monophosphatase family protein [Flexistipes sinusarabici]TYB33884.1 MAG: inositol monophosphatase [Flexistipes sinusarabici]